MQEWRNYTTPPKKKYFSYWKSLLSFQDGVPSLKHIAHLRILATCPCVYIPRYLNPLFLSVIPEPKTYKKGYLLAKQHFSYLELSFFPNLKLEKVFLSSSVKQIYIGYLY